MKIRKRRWRGPDGKIKVAWRVDHTDGRGRHQPQFGSKAEAELFLKKLIREEHSEKYGALLDDGITFDKFLAIYEEKKPWRTDSYRTRMLSALGLVPFQASPLRTIRSGDIDAYRDGRLKTSAPSTVRQDLAALHDCLKWAVRLRYLARNPCEGVERPSMPVKQDDPQPFIPKTDFYDKLMPEAGKDGPMWEFMAWTGLRITETLTLEWPDVRKDYLVVRRGKGRKQRVVPLLDPALKALGRAPRHVTNPRVFWYASDRHACLRRFYVRCERAKIGEFRLHDLRHTFGSWAAEAGVDLEVIAACMGHGSTTVTKLYAHLSPDYKRSQLAKMLGGTLAVHGAGKRAKTRGMPPS